MLLNLPRSDEGCGISFFDLVRDTARVTSATPLITNETKAEQRRARAIRSSRTRRKPTATFRDANYSAASAFEIQRGEASDIGNRYIVSHMRARAQRDESQSFENTEGYGVLPSWPTYHYVSARFPAAPGTKTHDDRRRHACSNDGNARMTRPDA